MSQQDQNPQDQVNEDVVAENQEEIQPEAAEDQVEVNEADAGQEESDLAEELAKLQAELEEAKADVLRAQAEVQNVRRRADQDVEKAHKFSIEKFAKELLPIVDNLERAMAVAPENDENTKAFIEGIEMTHKLFIDGLKKFSIEQVDPMGHPFDPELHQAMSMQENPDVEPNTVMAVFEKGYTNHGRLLRPAMVVVCKGAAKVDEKA